MHPELSTTAWWPTWGELGAARCSGRRTSTTMDFEVFGRDGVVSVKDDHRDVMMASNKPVPCSLHPRRDMNVAMLGSYMPGDWALGEHFGACRRKPTPSSTASARTAGSRSWPPVETGSTCW